MRGEYVVVAWAEVSAVELPPRARRIPERHRKENHHAGTTSACAENTIGGRTPSCARGNYLRVRGEYPHSVSGQAPPGELPPRARRILLGENWKQTLHGTTSACAENTALKRQTRGYEWNYLRVRGEYSVYIGAGARH